MIHLLKRIIYLSLCLSQLCMATTHHEYLAVRQELDLKAKKLGPEEMLELVKSICDQRDLQNLPIRWDFQALMAVYLYNLDRIDEAKKMAEFALKQTDLSSYARHYFNFTLGTYYSLKGNFPEAEKFMELAFASGEETGDYQKSVNALVQLSYVYSTQGKKDKIMGVLNLFQLYLPKVDAVQRVAIYDESAGLYSDMGEIDEAIRYSEKAVAGLTGEAGRGLAARVKTNLGLYYSAKKRLKDAIRIQLQALKDAEESKLFNLIVRIKYVLAETYAAMNDYNSAAQYLPRLIEDFDKLQDREYSYLARVLLAKIRVENRQWDQAQKLLKGAYDASGDVPSLKHRSRQSEMLEQHIRIKIGQGNWAEATQLLLKQKKLIEEIYEEKSKNDLDKFRIEFGTAVKEKENKLLEQEALLKEKELQKEKQLSRYYVSFLIGASAFLLVLSILLMVIIRAFKLIKRQTNAITLRVSELTHVLDNVDEGILLLTRDLKLKPNYSAFAKQLLQAEPDKMYLQEFLTRLGMEGDLRSQVTNILQATLGENSVAWTLNADNLPQSCAVGDTHLLLAWTPIVRDDLIEEVLISLRNTEVLRSLEAENERNQNIILAVRGGIQGFGFMNDFSQKVADLKLGDGDNKQVLRQLHTWKGELRNMGLSSMQDLVHAWEQSVMDRQLKNAQDLQSQVMEKSQLLIKVYQEIYGNEGESALTDPSQLIERALSDARKRLSQAGIDLETQVTLGPVSLDLEELQSLNLIAIHAIANCVDHGFLKNLDKFPVRPQRAHLRIDLSENQGRRHIAISDDGIGVNWRGLEAKARELNLSWESEEQLLELVWEDNVSTLDKSNLSQTSGRGLGMAAIRQAVLDLGGEIHFSPRANNRGTLLIASWPKKSKNVPAVA